MLLNHVKYSHVVPIPLEFMKELMGNANLSRQFNKKYFPDKYLPGPGPGREFFFPIIGPGKQRLRRT